MLTPISVEILCRELRNYQIWKKKGKLKRHISRLSSEIANPCMNALCHVTEIKKIKRKEKRHRDIVEAHEW